MERIPEPELMTEEAQAKAYAQANFAEAHQRYVELFAATFPKRPAHATALDLGCGAADVTIRFAKANPGYLFHAIDGSAAMLRYAAEAVKQHRDLNRRIHLIHGSIPGAAIPAKAYDLILSSSFLHHLHDPQVLWRTVQSHSKSGTLVFVADLFRPLTPVDAKALVEKHSGSEPPVLRRDFFNSLLAAFTPEEVQNQLRDAGLNHLRVRVISDRHLVVWGTVDRR